MSKRLLIACAKRYNGHELWTLLGVLQQRGHFFEVVSQEHLIKDELTLRPNIVDRTLYEVDPQEAASSFDAFVVVSGNMADTEAYWTDPHMEAMLKAFKNAGKVLAAICCSVPTLAPVVRGVEVSYFPLVRSKHRLSTHGAILKGVSLTVDVAARTVTAENQMMTQPWGDEICNMLEGLPPKLVLTPSGFTPKGAPRLLEKDTQEMIDAARLAKGLPLTPGNSEGKRFKDPKP